MRRRPGSLRRSVLTLVLSLSRRPVPVEGSRPRRGAASSYEVPADGASTLALGRAYWLPPTGRGNGVEALFWAPAARLPGDRVEAVLDALRRQDIAAWVDAVPARGRPVGADRPHDLWVGSADLDTAQDALVRLLAP